MGYRASRFGAAYLVLKHPVSAVVTIAAVLVPSETVRAHLFAVVARWGPSVLVRAWSAGSWGLSTPLSISGLKMVLLRFPALGLETAYDAFSKLAATLETSGIIGGDVARYSKSTLAKKEGLEVWLSTQDPELALSILKKALSKRDTAAISFASRLLIQGSHVIDEATALRTARLLWTNGYQLDALHWAASQVHNSKGDVPVELAIWLVRSRNLSGLWVEALSDWLAAEPRLRNSSGNQLSRYLREVGRAAEMFKSWHLNCQWDESTGDLVFVRVDSEPHSVVSAIDLFTMAVMANPHSVGALVDLARWERIRGNLRSAREHLARVLLLLHTAPTDTRLRFYHAVVFELHYVAGGRAQERDLMWDLSVSGSDFATLDVGETAVGCFRAEIAFSGLRLSGFVACAEATSVQLCMDDVPIKTINLPSLPLLAHSSQRRRVREFRFLVHRDVLESTVDRVEISFRTDTGEALLAPSGARCQLVALGQRQEEIPDFASPRRRLQVTKKGRVSAPEGSSQAAAYLELYLTARDAFAQLFGIDLMVGYGTLLGAVRAGATIPGDDDFDAVYVSSGSDPKSVRLESHRLIVDLINDGFSVTVNRRGVPFRLHSRGQHWRKTHIDIRAVWFQEGRAFARNYLSFPSIVGDWLPPSTLNFDGRKVLAPSKPEVFLLNHYGTDWRTPDGGFRYHSDFQPLGVSKILRSMTFSMQDYEMISERLRYSRTSRSGVFMPLVTQDLYPLRDYIA